jgi:hypothetical protein
VPEVTDEPADASVERHLERHPERHRAPALWVVVGGIGVAVVVGVAEGARSAAIVLAVTLLGAGLARVAGRGRRPEGVAVRSTWWDAVVLWGLAAGILLLQGTPGV